MHCFAGLPHRSQLVGERGGVRFVNDSKATNVDSAAKALQAFPKIRWIAGGLGKEGGIAALLPFLGSVVEGLSDRPFGARFRAADRRRPRMRSARRWSGRSSGRRQRREPGEVVLLAPAAASFDQYPNFEKRGEDFTARVKAVLEA